MKDNARDSLGEFESSIFDASDGHQLVDFIRKKKGLRTQPLKIFGDVQCDRQSLQIEIQRLDDEERSENEDNTLKPQPEAPKEPSPVKLVKDNAQSTSVHNNSANQTRRSANRSPAYGDAKLKLKRLSHSIGRRTLLKEFEKTLQESRFLPATFSTPLSQDSPNAPVTTSPMSVGEKAPNQPTNANQRNSVNQDLLCSPITISDSDSPTPPPKNQSKQNKTSTSNDNTEDVMRDLQKQNDMLLALQDTFNKAHNTGIENKNPSSSLNPHLRSPPPDKTYTKNNTFLAPDKSREASAREPLSPTTPVKNIQINASKLVVTPEQKRLLLSRFGRSSTVVSSPQNPAAASVLKTSRIPIRGVTAAPSDKPATPLRQVVRHQETAHIIEQLQKGNPTNAPMIVIPVNQTFNQAPAKRAPTKAVESSPSSNEISSTTTTTLPQPEPIETQPPDDERIPINSLRLEDIITEDEDSSRADDPPRMRSRPQLQQRKNKSSTDTLKNHQQKLSLTRRAPPQPRASSQHVRQIISSEELTQLSVHEILDLRKRNSRGDLQRKFQLTTRESNMLDKQVELEFLRRSIQENNYEDEILQMEVLPAPPKEFSDTRKSSRLHPELAADCLVEDDLVDECSSDRISLSQRNHQHVPKKSIVGQKGGRRKKKMSEQVEKYLEVGVMVSQSKSRYLNRTKRKLYNKGDSEESSDDSIPLKSYRRIVKPEHTPKKLSKSHRKQRNGAPLVKDNSRRTPASPNSSAPSLLLSPPSQPSTPLHLSPPAEFATTLHSLPHHRRSSPQHNDSARLRTPRSRSSQHACPPQHASPPQHTSPRQYTSPPRHSVPRRSAVRHSSPRPHSSPRFSTPRRSAPRHSSPRHSAPNPQRNSSPPRPSGTPSPALPSPPAAFANESEVRIQFLPNDNDIFKKPIGVPPKKKVAKQKPKPRASHHPVDPDVVLSSSKNGTPAVRRSSREKKPLTAYWSCSQTEFRPLFDLNILYHRKNTSILAKANAKKAKNLPTRDNNLVANTKTVRSNSVEKTQMEKKLTKKQQKEQESLRAKHAHQNDSENNSLSSHCPSFHSSASATESHLPKTKVRAFATMREEPEETAILSERAIVTEVIKRNTNHSSKTAKSKAADHTIKTTTSKSKEVKSSIDSEATTSDCPQKATHSQQLFTITEDSELDTHHAGSTADLKKSSKSKLKGPKSRMQISTAHQLGKGPAKPKTKGAISNRQQLSADSDVVSDDPPVDYSSSIQKVRLATIAEHSIPEPVCEVTVIASEKAISNSRTKTLPAPKESRSRSNKFKQTTKDTFRTEHDESIADVSSVYVNNLFDQLKSSSMCVAKDVTTAQQVSCSGQLSHNSRAKDHHAAATPKCKNFTVRLLRMKNKKMSQGDEKVCDSGFSSEDMSSAPKQKSGGSGDLLLNWLKNILSKNPTNSEKGVARFLQADGFHAASVDDLIFQELDGVDYAFYDTKEQFSFGYMRFNPKTQKKKSIAKKYELNLFVLCGTLKVTVNRNTFDCKSGDLITVFIGTTYGINNISNDPALVMVIKK